MKGRVTGLFLTHDDITLYYDVLGEGEPLVLVHGVVVDAEFYRNAANYLSKYFKVVIFDRRNSSRSSCPKGTSYEIPEQVEDIRILMDTLGIEKTYMVGASAGAILGQVFLQTYPDRVKKLIMYEPALIGMLPDEHEYRQWVAMMKDLIGNKKLNKAMLEFVESLGAQDPRSPQKTEEQSMTEMRNIHPFLKNEYALYMDYQPNIERAIELGDQFVVAVGESSGDAPYASVAKMFAKAVGKEPLYYPGLHNMPYDLPREFALSVIGTFALF